MSNNKQFKTPFCKVCFDAGKTEKEYTSHYVRSNAGPNSKVVCPTLLNLSCSYCGNSGHTPKFCTILTSNKKMEAKQISKAQSSEKRVLEQKKANSKQPKVEMNKFAAFCDDDTDSEAEEEVKVPVSKEVSYVDFPSLTQSSNSNAKQTQPVKKMQPKTNILSALKQVCPGVNVTAKMPDVDIPKPVMTKLVRNEGQEDYVEKYIKDATSAKGINMGAFYEEAVAAYNKCRFPASTADWAAVEEESEDEDYETNYKPDEDEDW